MTRIREIGLHNKRVWNAVLECNLKYDRMNSFCFQGKPFNITVIQPYASTSNTEEAEVERIYEDLQDLLELTPKKDVLFITGESEVAQSCPTLCDPVDCSLPGSSVHGIFQAIVLEWIAISFSSRSSWPRDGTQVSRIVDRRFTIWATKEVHYWLKESLKSQIG